VSEQKKRNKRNNLSYDAFKLNLQKCELSYDF